VRILDGLPGFVPIRFNANQYKYHDCKKQQQGIDDGFTI
jgi:hypothetical protein